MTTAVSVTKYILIFILAVCIASAFQVPLTSLYKSVFPNETGGGFDINFTGVVVLSYAVEFLLPLLILALGGKSRYWVACAAVVLLAILEFFIDSFNFGVPVTLLFSGAFFGLLIRFLASNTLGKIQALEPYKKYF